MPDYKAFEHFAFSVFGESKVRKYLIASWFHLTAGTIMEGHSGGSAAEGA